MFTLISYIENKHGVQLFWNEKDFANKPTKKDFSKMLEDAKDAANLLGFPSAGVAYKSDIDLKYLIGYEKKIK